MRGSEVVGMSYVSEYHRQPRNQPDFWPLYIATSEFLTVPRSCAIQLIFDTIILFHWTAPASMDSRQRRFLTWPSPSGNMDGTSSSPFHIHIYNTNRQQRKPEAKNDPMATVSNGNTGTGNLDIYPAFCFKASPTHFAWVKMAAVDVHRLERRRGFEGMFIIIIIIIV